MGMGWGSGRLGVLEVGGLGGGEEARGMGEGEHTFLIKGIIIHLFSLAWFKVDPSSRGVVPWPGD